MNRIRFGCGTLASQTETCHLLWRHRAGAVVASRLLTTSNAGHRKPKVAVVLSGCGVFDGSEIHEATSVLIHLSRGGAEYACFAPNTSFAAFNHATDEQTQETRNVLEESARISRGQIRDLEQLVASEFDAVIFPGGYGAAKNLSTFAAKGEDCSIRDDVKEAIDDFVSASKPIGMCCIAPVLAAKCIPGVEITLGNNKDVERAVTLMGAKHVAKAVHEVHVDVKHKVVTTPAYMHDAACHEVYDGIGNMIHEVLRLVERQ